MSSTAAVVVVLALAAVLRIGHVLALRDLPLFSDLTLDSSIYDQLARSISAGNWLGHGRAFYQDPLYPYLLAVIYRIAGHDLLVVRLLQSCMGVATCALVFVIGRQVAGRAVGMTAALLMALYAPAIFNEAEVEKTALGVLFVTAALLLAMGRSGWSILGAGVFLGLASLTRANLLLMVPLGMLFFMTEPYPPEPHGALLRRWPWYAVTGRQGGNALLFLIGCLLVLSPVLWRNYHVSGEWVLTTSQAGTNFYTGNNPSNSLGGFVTVPFVRANPIHEEDDFRDEAERRANRKLSPPEVSSFWFRESLNHIRQNPGFAATVFLRKIVLFCSDVELPDGWCMYFLSRYSAVLRLPLPGMGFIFPLAALGAAVSFRTSRETRLLAGYVALYAVSVVLFFIFSRYRMYVAPPMMVFAALGLQWLWRQVQARSIRRATAGVVSCMALGLFSYSGAALFDVRQGAWVHNFWQLADLYEHRGDYETALGLVYEARQKYPESDETVCRIAKLQQLQGDHAAAIESYTRCLELNGTRDGAWYDLGVSYEATGEYDAAVSCYRRELIVRPDHVLARERLDRLGGTLPVAPERVTR